MRALAIGCFAALSFATPRAEAFCGFYVGGAGTQMFNNATEVVLMRHGTTTVLFLNDRCTVADSGELIITVASA